MSIQQLADAAYEREMASRVEKFAAIGIDPIIVKIVFQAGYAAGRCDLVAELSGQLGLMVEA